MEEIKKERSGAVKKVRSLMGTEPMTLPEIKKRLPELTEGQISMSLCYLKKRGLVDFAKTQRQSGHGRKEINSYTLRV